MVHLRVLPHLPLPLGGHADGLGEDPERAGDGEGVDQHDGQAAGQVSRLVLQFDVGAVADGVAGVRG